MLSLKDGYAHTVIERNGMKTKRMFLTSVDYYNDPVKNIPIVRLFGRDRWGNPLALWDADFYPYFYLASPRQADKRMIASSGAEIVGEVELEHYSKSYTCAKIRTRLPSDIPRLRDKLKKRMRMVFSADILYPFRYLYDKDLGPFVSVTFNENNEVKNIERCKAFHLWDIDHYVKPKLKVMTFDIEASLRTGQLYCIAAQINGEEGVVFHGGEKEQIEQFCNWVMHEDPDIINGYNIIGFDLPFLLKVCDRVGTTLSLGKNGESPWTRENKKTNSSGLSYRRWKEWFLTGRIIVDTWQQVKQELKPIQENLGFVGELLKVGSKDNIDASRIEDEWKNRKQEVIDYCMQDVNVTYKVFAHEKIASMDKSIAIAQACDLPLEHCFTPKNSRLTDSILIRRFDKAGIAVPTNDWEAKGEKIKGATVFDVARPGVFKDIVIMDFKSMYPSVIIKNNICPSTYMSKTDKYTKIIKVSPIGAYFRQDKEGILPEVLKELWEWRDQTKLKIKNTGDYFDRLQYSIKVLMNSFYGVMASDFYRFTNPLIGGSVTAFAREGIQKVYDKLNEVNYEVIYGDTDSVFVDLNGDDPFEVAKELSKEGLEMEVEKILTTFFTHGAKKRYAAMVKWPKESFYVIGYELKRGDSFKLQREGLESVLRIILDGDPDQAFRYVSSIVKKIRNGNIDLEDLIITKNVRNPRDYKNPDSMPGVQAAMKLKARGFPWLSGTKVSWIVTNAKKSPQEVEPYVENSEMNIRPDLDYYSARLIKTISDIAKVFEWDDIGISSGTKQLKLF